MRNIILLIIIINDFRIVKILKKFNVTHIYRRYDFIIYLIICTFSQ